MNKYLRQLQIQSLEKPQEKSHTSIQIRSQAITRHANLTHAKLNTYLCQVMQTVSDEHSDDGHDDERENEKRGGPGSGTQTLVKPKPKLAEPSYFKVVLLNDDFTPMDFVVNILTKFFGKSTEEATKVMMQVHQQGAGIAGVYSHEIAETKVYLVNDFARKNKHPLKCVMEKES